MEREKGSAEQFRFKENEGVSIAVSGTLILVLVTVAAIVIALVVKVIKGSRVQAEDNRTIQEVHEGFSRLEKRIETLETILLDRRREGHKE